MLACAQFLRNRNLRLAARNECCCSMAMKSPDRQSGAANWNICAARYDQLISRYVLFAGDGFTIVVLDSFFSAGLVTLVSFFSHAANSAAIIARQMYFFMSSYRVL